VSDRYQQLVNTPIGRMLTRQVGLPAPVKLERHEPGRPVVDGPVLLAAAPGGRLAPSIANMLAAIGAEVHTPLAEEVRSAAAAARIDAPIFNPQAASPEQTFKAIVFDASGIDSSERLREAYELFHGTIRRIRECGRVLVLGTPPEECEPPAAIAQRALEGLSRSIGKEVRKGATAQLIYVGRGAEDAIESTLRFFISRKAAYVSGQVVRIVKSAIQEDLDWDRPLAGKVALVTGASRGIGESIAGVLARDGAHVVGIDVPAMAAELDAVSERIGGSGLTLDITAEDAPKQIASRLMAQHGGVDVVIHNAGITRDKTLGRMAADQWDSVIAANLIAPQRIDRELFGQKVMRDGGRVVCVSSISGIAGNAGQTNYATSKAGVIGIVQAWAPALAKLGATINAVAPGFIETRMTAAMPLAAREAGRRMNSMAQGGLPIDVAETVAWFASPGSGGVTGNIVRVCGQSLIGA
jgi:3-oxoacyl-[acyl-carrier protein] reductase